MAITVRTDSQGTKFIWDDMWALPPAIATGRVGTVKYGAVTLSGVVIPPVFDTATSDDLGTFIWYGSSLPRPGIKESDFIYLWTSKRPNSALITHRDVDNKRPFKWDEQYEGPAPSKVPPGRGVDPFGYMMTNEAPPASPFVPFNPAPATPPVPVKPDFQPRIPGFTPTLPTQPIAMPTMPGFNPSLNPKPPTSPAPSTPPVTPPPVFNPDPQKPVLTPHDPKPFPTPIPTNPIPSPTQPPVIVSPGPGTSPPVPIPGASTTSEKMAGLGLLIGLLSPAWLPLLIFRRRGRR